VKLETKNRKAQRTSWALGRRCKGDQILWDSLDHQHHPHRLPLLAAHNNVQKIVRQLKRRVKAGLHLRVCAVFALADCAYCSRLSAMRLEIKPRNQRLA